MLVRKSHESVNANAVYISDVFEGSGVLIL